MSASEESNSPAFYSALEAFAETMVAGKPIGNDVQLPERLGRFAIRSLLGSGGFGVVLLGFDEVLSRQVAIKVPKGELSEEAIEEFLFEARRLAQLQHPGIVAVHDVAREKNLCYIVTEYLEGVSLKQRIDNRALTIPQGVNLVIQLADAVGHAHSRGVMHRDIKPANVMLTHDGRCVLLDFGLAVNDLEAVRGEVAGTPAYMAPEQIRGESHRIDGRSDIYSLGVILYEMLTGRMPFRAKDRDELFKRILADPPQPIRQLNPAVSRDLEAVCQKALQKDIIKRHETAGDFAEALRVALQAFAVAQSEEQLIHSALSPDPPQHVDSQNVAFDSTKTVTGSDSSNLSRRLKEAELRQITMVAVRFDLIDREFDPEQEHDVINSFQHLVATCANEFGGEVLVASGNQIELCFGFPMTFEDATARAVRCGLEIQKCVCDVQQMPQKDEISVFVHSGRAVAEETPQGVRVTGEVQKALTRLVPHVSFGSLNITSAVRSHVNHIFKLSEAIEVRVRGQSEEVRLYDVLGERSSTLNRVELVDPGNLTPLIGRSTELSILKERWEQAREEMGQVVLLIGEAGLGKSRLIREIREHVSEEDNVDIIELRCSQHHSSAGLFPVVEHFHQQFNFETNVSAEDRIASINVHLGSLGLLTTQNTFLIANLLGVADKSVTAIDLSPQRRRELTSELLLEMMRKRAELRPVLFIVEDLHWVDPSLLELLSAYVESFDQHRALSIFTFRPEFETPWKSKQHQTQIALNRLTRRQIREMLQQRLGSRTVPDDVVEQMADRTDGIPLFIEEFSNLLNESTSPEGDSIQLKQFAKVIPTSLQDLLKARLDRMEIDPKVIQLAAAIGREFTYKLLSAAADLDDEALQSELEKLLRAEILFQKGTVPDATFIFKHALIQDSAYDSLLTKRRQSIHERIGRAIEASFPEVARQQPELLAHHFTEAGMAEQAIDYWQRAGKRAQSLSAKLESINHFNRGLQVVLGLPDSPQKLGLELAFQLGLSVSLMAVHGYAAPIVEEKLTRARQICDEIGEGAPQFPVIWANWALCVVADRLKKASECSDELLVIAEQTQDPGIIAEAELTCSCNSIWLADYERSLSSAKKSLANFDREASLQYMAITGQNVGVMSSQYKVIALWCLGQFDAALAAREEGIALARDINHPFSSTCYFQHCGLFGVLSQNVETARVDADMGLSIAKEHAYPYWIGMNMMIDGAVMALEDRLAEAAVRLREGIDKTLSTGAAATVSLFDAILADTLRKLGRLDEARLALQQGYQRVEDGGGKYSMVHLLLAQANMEAGDAGQKLAMKAVEFATKRKAWFLALRAALVLEELGGGSRELIARLYNGVAAEVNAPDVVRARARLNQI